jgi:hypothetical protein
MSFIAHWQSQVESTNTRSRTRDPRSQRPNAIAPGKPVFSLTKAVYLNATIWQYSGQVVNAGIAFSKKVPGGCPILGKQRREHRIRAP